MRRATENQDKGGRENDAENKENVRESDSVKKGNGLTG